MNQLEREASAALNDFMARRVVFFSPGAPRDQPEWVSSGTPFASPGGHVVVLTAWHCAKDATRHPTRLGYHRAVQAIQDAVAGVMYHPDPTIDVGLLMLKAEARRALHDVALNVDAIADPDDVAPGDGVFLAGFPSKLTFQEGPRYFGLVSVTYGTFLAAPDHDAEGRYRVQWTERETNAGLVPMPDPEGISGGALWRFRGDPNTLWAPETRLRLLGVPVAWRAAEKVEVAEPSSKWKAWLIDALDEVDRTFPLAT